MTNWYVITGGPSSGKTTTVDLLRARGYTTTIEDARHYLDLKQNRIGPCYLRTSTKARRKDMSALTAPGVSRLSGWKRLAIVLLAVPAILVGLLAMHILTTSGPSHAADNRGSNSHTSMVADESASSGALTAHGTTDCASVCGQEHHILGMACILALLMTALLLTVHLTLLRWDSLRNILTAIIARIAALAPPQPPSLLVLSISRT